MAETKTVSLRLPVEMAEWIEKRGNGAGINHGVKNVATALMAMERHADMMIKDVFAPEEWRAMADCMNGTMVLDEIRFSKDALLMEMQDGQLYNKVLDKWSVEPELFFAKIEALNPVQVEAVFRRIENFWDLCNDIDLNEWSKY